MVLVAVGEDNSEEVVAPLLDETEIRKDELDAGIEWIRKRHAEIDHDPFAATPVEIDVHANLSGSAERQE